MGRTCGLADKEKASGALAVQASGITANAERLVLVLFFLSAGLTERTSMTELTIVRENLMTVEGYTGYCGNDIPMRQLGGCYNPRTKWDGEQFVCPNCKWRSQFPEDFITRYKARWGK